jgi:hypothetical protein
VRELFRSTDHFPCAAGKGGVKARRMVPAKIEKKAPALVLPGLFDA